MDLKLPRPDAVCQASVCPQASGCVARLSGDLSHSSHNSGLQPCKGYSCYEKGWWSGCIGCTLSLMILCWNPLCFAMSMCLNKVVEEFSVFSVATAVIWQDSLLPRWPLAVHQIWMYSQAGQPWDLCSCCQHKDRLVRVVWGTLRRRPVHYKLVWTCRAISCLSPRSYQRVMTLSLVCNWDGCEVIIQMCKTPSHN